MKLQSHLPSTRLAMVGVVVFSFALFAHDAKATNKQLTNEQIASTAAQMIKKIPKDEVKQPRARRFSTAAAAAEAAALAASADSITVIADRDPEDINTSKRPPLLAFRQRLDNDRPSTPYEKTQFVLCLVGLCGAGYGPDGAPVENKAYTRAEKKKDTSSLELTKQFTGTYQ